MSDEQPPIQPASPLVTPPATPRPARARGGCAGRFLAALLVVLITTFLALVGGAAGLLYLGFTPATPQQLAEAQLQLATMQSQNISLQTQVAAHEQRGSADHEAVGDLKRAVGDMASLRSQLEQERASSAAQSATLVADVRAGRDAVALFATAEAGRAALLEELERRSARVERFLQRLGDIASDTALDLGSATPLIPTQIPTPAGPPTPTAADIPTPAPASPVGPARTPAASATPAPTRTPNITPRTSPTLTPTAGR